MMKLLTNVVSTIFFRDRVSSAHHWPFTNVAKYGLVYTLNLPCKRRTNPELYVGLLKLYRDLSHVNLDAIGPLHWPCHRLLNPDTGCKLSLNPG